MHSFTLALPIFLIGSLSFALTPVPVDEKKCAELYSQAHVSYTVSTDCSQTILDKINSCIKTQSQKATAYETAATVTKGCFDVVRLEQSKLNQEQLANSNAERERQQAAAREAARVAAAGNNNTSGAAGASSAAALAPIAAALTKPEAKPEAKPETKPAATATGETTSATVQQQATTNPFTASANSTNNKPADTIAATKENELRGEIASNDGRLIKNDSGNVTEYTVDQDTNKIVSSTQYADGGSSNPTEMNFGAEGAQSLEAAPTAGFFDKLKSTASEAWDNLTKGSGGSSSPLSEAGSKILNAPSDASSVSAPSTSIKEAADQKSAQLKSSVETAANSAQSLSQGDTAFVKTASAISQVKADVEKYLAAKQACVTATERANLLCLESTSPGVKAAKTLMEVAGPAIAVMSSAQKTCSSTASATQLAGTGLMIAKGVCVAAKAMCDMSCSKAATELKTLTDAVNGKILAASNSESPTVYKACAARSNNDMSGTCMIGVSEKNTTAQTAATQLRQAFQAESAPSPGTSPQLVAQCGSYTKDIVSLGVQAAGALMASKNAKACADKLAATTGGVAVTALQYCEMPANASSQYCKCQKNNMEAGCPGAVAAAVAAKNAADQNGVNIKGVGGTSAFAGGFKTAAPANNLGKNATNALAAAGSSAGTTGSDSAASGGGVGGGSVGGGGGISGSSAGASDAASGSGAAGEKKKWSFGSFAGFGDSSSSGSSGSGKAGASGALGSKDLNAIKRRIASEKISAEVSSASGKSNWEKVRSMYLLKEGSFLLGQ